MTSWRAFRRLSGFERAVVIEAAAGLIATWAGLRLLGFRRWKTVLVRLSPAEDVLRAAENHEPLGFARRISQLQEATARRLPFRPSCLEQSLVLWWLLRLRSIFAALWVGGRKEDDRFEAHAWVEFCGAVLSSPLEDHHHFIPFDGPIADMETPIH
jgi:hypothetical protein